MASAPLTLSGSSATAAAPDGAPQDSQPAVDVTAITQRDDFLLELGQALGGQAAVRPVETLAEALPVMKGGRRAQVLVIDARAVAEVRAAIDAAHAQVPGVVVLVFAEGAAEQALGASLKGSKVFAVLATEIEPRKTQAVFEGALAEAVALKAPPAPHAAPRERDLAPGEWHPRHAARASEAPPARSSRLWLIGAALAAAAGAAAAFWFFTRGHGAAAPPARPVAAAAQPTASAAAPVAPAAKSPPAGEPATNFIVEGKVDELLEKARLAMHERRFAEPAGDNALLYYRSAVAADRANAEALDGLQRVAGVLAARFEEALGAGHLDEATLTLGSFRAAAGADAHLAGFEQRLYSAQLARALADGSLERAAAVLRVAQQSQSVPPEQLARWRNEIARRQDEQRIQHLLSLIEDRIRDGRLTDADDGAKTYMVQLAAAAATNAATQRAAHDLTAAYLKKAREAALAKNATEEERWLDEARGLGLKPAELSAFQRELAGVRQKAAQAEAERLLQLARGALREGRLTDPDRDNAAAYLSQLQSGEGASAAVADASRELAGKLLERARAAVQAGASADADLAQAKRWGADAKDMAAVQQLASAKAKRPDAATLAASLKKLRAPPPDYPPTALAQHISGSVTLEFTIDTSGAPRDVHVVEATPPGVFDSAAVNAVRHWRYAPTLVEGTAVEVPVRTRMRFELPK